MDKNEALAALRIDRGPNDFQASRGGRLVAASIALIVLAGGGIGAWVLLAPRAVAVETTTVQVVGGSVTGRADSVLNASGYVVAELSTAVSSQVTGMIEKVLVTEGMRVEKGQVLAYLDDAKAKAQVATAKSQLLAETAAVAEAEARLALDKLKLARLRKLVAQHLTRQADMDQAQAAVNIDLASLEQAKARVAVAHNNLDAEKISLDYSIIRAPFAGVVTEKYAHPGEMISPSAVGGFTKTGVCQLVDMGSLEIDVDVSEAYIQRIKEDMRVEAVLDAYPDWRIPAHVISVVPTANRQKATVRVRIAFNHLDPRIVPEMGVQVWFYQPPPKAGERKPATVLVPSEAVHDGGTERYVFLVDDGRATRRTVIVGANQNGMVSVLSGLTGGERVIVSAPKALNGGEEVEPNET